MADAKSNYLENLFLTWLLTTDSVTRPTSWYVALFTSDPTDSDAGDEVTGGSYARQAITFDVVNNEATNEAVIEFTDMPDETISHWAIYDAATAGNMLYYAPLVDTKDLNAGDTVVFPIGDLLIREK